MDTMAFYGIIFFEHTKYFYDHWQIFFMELLEQNIKKSIINFSIFLNRISKNNNQSLYLCYSVHLRELIYKYRYYNLRKWTLWRFIGVLCFFAHTVLLWNPVNCFHSHHKNIILKNRNRISKNNNQSLYLYTIESIWVFNISIYNTIDCANGHYGAL